MNELEQALIGSSAAAPPDHILEALDQQAVHRTTPGAPHTIYQEVWHLAFWQQVSLDWVDGIETPCPVSPALGFPSAQDAAREDWDSLRRRFLDGARKAAAVARDQARLDRPVRCPSLPGLPVRTMSVRDQLVSLAAHNAYHLGRVVLLRQLHGSWPPPSGGFTW